MPKRSTSTKSKSKINAIVAPLYNLNGELIGKTKLPEEIFNKSDNPALIAQAVRVYQANQRAGSASTKTRSEVTGSTRKIYRQKGTGRARHGDLKAPIFIGGGIAHGPKMRDYSLDLPKKMRRLALFTSLSQATIAGKIKVIRGLERILPKTKEMMQLLHKIYNIPKNKKTNFKILVIIHQRVHNLHLACRNLNYLTLRPANLLNTYDVMSNRELVFLEDSIKKLKDTFLTIQPRTTLPEISPKTSTIIKNQLKTVIKPAKSKLRKKTSSVKKLKTKAVKAKIRK